MALDVLELLLLRRSSRARRHLPRRSMWVPQACDAWHYSQRGKKCGGHESLALLVTHHRTEPHHVLRAAILNSTTLSSATTNDSHSRAQCANVADSNTRTLAVRELRVHITS